MPRRTPLWTMMAVVLTATKAKREVFTPWPGP